MPITVSRQTLAEFCFASRYASSSASIESRSKSIGHSIFEKTAAIFLNRPQRVALVKTYVTCSSSASFFFTRRVLFFNRDRFCRRLSGYRSSEFEHAILMHGIQMLCFDTGRQANRLLE